LSLSKTEKKAFSNFIVARITTTTSTTNQQQMNCIFHGHITHPATDAGTLEYRHKQEDEIPSSCTHGAAADNCTACLDNNDGIPDCDRSSLYSQNFTKESRICTAINRFGPTEQLSTPSKQSNPQTTVCFYHSPAICPSVDGTGSRRLILEDISICRRGHCLWNQGLGSRLCRTAPTVS
jgi:hypothetical protein